MEVTTDWQMDLEKKEAKKLTEIITSHARKLKKALQEAHEKEEKYAAIFAYYRKYYTLTLCKSCVAAGINKSPTRDIILDFPWKDLNQDRFFCLKIWEKINK
jgi:HSP90 family molecular chaperone